jgi:hypothetical protein
MSDALQALLAQLEESRRQWVELEPGRSVHLVRATEVQMAMLPGKSQAEKLAFFCSLVVGWRGFTCGDLGGDAAKPLDYSPEAWAAIWPDQFAWVALVSEAAVRQFDARQAAKGAAAKN